MIAKGRRTTTVFFALLLTFTLLIAVAAVSRAQSTDSGAAQTTSADRSGVDQPTGAFDSSRLLAEAEREGSVRVIVRLRTDFVPEGRLSRPQVADQRSAIQSAQEALRADLQGTGYRALRDYDTIPSMALELPPRALQAVERSPLVTDVVEDRPLPALLAESAPLVQAPSMWSGDHTGSGQAVAVLDTGVQSSHPFLAGKVIEEACYSGGSDCPNGSTTQTGSGSGVPCTYAASGCTHGTHVAGIAAGQGSSFSGVARGAGIMSVQVFSRFAGANCTGAGEDPCTLSYTSDQIKGLERVYALRSAHSFASVNMSLGSGRYLGYCDSSWQATKLVIDNLRSVGIATVIASGNDGYADSMNAPACISSAVSVGSTTKADAASFTNSASFLSLLAPGSNINSSVSGGGFALKSGTSMATPHVAGAWALLKHQNPSASVESVLSALQSTGTPVKDPRNGLTKPRINVADAAAALSPVPNDNFANARELTGPSATVTGTSNGATKETGEPNHAGNAGGKSVWYKWTPQANGTATIDTADSDFDTLLAVYTGSTMGGLTAVAGNDDANGGGDGVRTSRVDFPVTAGSTYRIAVDGHNSAGAGAAAGNVTLHLAPATPDTTPPNVSLSSPSGGAVVRDATVTLSAEANDNVGVQRVEFLVDGSVVGADTSSPYSVQWNSTTVTDGFVTVRARAFDAAGNSTITDPGREVVVDNTSPETTITAGPTGVRAGTTATFEFTSTERDSAFRCSLDGASFSTCSSPRAYTSLSEGQHTFRVYAVGAAGEAADSDITLASRSWTVDTVAPSAPLINSPAEGSFNNTGNVTLSGTVEAGTTVELFEGTAFRGTTQTSAGGDWSKALTGVADGSYTYTAKATDAAGNTSGVSNARTVIVDTMKPRVASTKPANGATRVAPGANVSATFSEAMDASYINTSTFKLVRQGTSTLVAAAVSYDAATKTVTLDPSVRLKRRAVYTATVSTGVEDQAGNPLAQNETWSFKVRR